MSDSEIECTPPELREAAISAGKNLLPEKSGFRYEKCFKEFKNWCDIKNVKNCTENVVLAYFNEKSQNRKPSTLWATYSMLRTTLDINDKVDISKYTKLIAFLKKKNVGYTPKKSSVFCRADIDKFINEAPLEYLVEKVNISYLLLQALLYI